MYAAAMGCLDTAHILISKGAAVWLRDKNEKRDFFHYAFARANWELVVSAFESIRTVYHPIDFQVLVSFSIIAAFTYDFRQDYNTDSWFLPKLLNLCEDVEFINSTLGDPYRGTKNNTLMHFMLSVEEAEALYGAGFNRFNAPNSKGELAVRSLAKRHDAALIRFCIEKGTNLNYLDQDGKTLLFELVSQLGSSSWLAWETMDSITLCLDAGIDVFASDTCKCPCSHHGCDISSAFEIDFSSGFPVSWDMPDPVWTLEWISLLRTTEAQRRQERCSWPSFRRALVDEHDISIPHVCCHRGSGKSAGSGSFLYEAPKPLHDEDILEILTEETDFVELLRTELGQLAL